MLRSRAVGRFNQPRVVVDGGDWKGVRLESDGQEFVTLPDDRRIDASDFEAILALAEANDLTAGDLLSAVLLDEQCRVIKADFRNQNLANLEAIRLLTNLQVLILDSSDFEDISLAGRSGKRRHFGRHRPRFDKRKFKLSRRSAAKRAAKGKPLAA
jgi:hypothetical protein